MARLCIRARRLAGTAHHAISNAQQEPCGQRSRHWMRERWPLRKLVEAFAEALEAHRETDAFLGRLEDDEGRGLPRPQLLDQILVHDDLGDAAVRQAAYEPGAAD